MLTLTSTGAQHLSQACDATCAPLTKVLVGLSPTDLRHVVSGLTCLAAAFEEISTVPRR